MDEFARPGPGHNNGPQLDENHAWRRHCWAQARRELLGHIPLEIVRMRIARARELGLLYPQYASILLGTGRDVTAFLFTAEGLQLKLARRLSLPAAVRDKLAGLVRCERLVLAPQAEDPAGFLGELEDHARLNFASAGVMPDDSAGWGRVRRQLHEALRPLKLPMSSIVMIGSRDRERFWADAAGLAKFLPSDAYFRPSAPQD